jgi:hypothetical protein
MPFPRWLLAIPSLVAVGCTPAAPPGAADAAPDAGSRPARVAPVTVAQYPDGSGPFLRVPLSLNGSPPLQVLLDTGSDGLRVFADALGETPVERTSRPVDVEFGAGDRMSGVLARATVQVGEVATPAPIAFHIVDSFTCAPGTVGCDVFAQAGIQGILGVSLRPGVEPDIYSPFAQLAPEDAAGFLLRVGEPVGELSFGPELLGLEGFARRSLPRAGLLPNGRPAFRDDTVEGCFRVNGGPTTPPCIELVFDTGASPDIVYAPGLPAGTVADGILAPGTRLEVSLPGLWTRALTVGPQPEPGEDLIIVDSSVPFSILGLGWFRRFDVLYDLQAGELGFRERAP